jgi:hypothetical protein
MANTLLELRSTMRIKLIRKLAPCLNGVDVSKLQVGDEVDLPERSASLLLADGWAERIEPFEAQVSHRTFDTIPAD